MHAMKLVRNSNRTRGRLRKSPIVYVGFNVDATSHPRNPKYRSKITPPGSRRRIVQLLKENKALRVCPGDSEKLGEWTQYRMIVNRKKLQETRKLWNEDRQLHALNLWPYRMGPRMIHCLKPASHLETTSPKQLSRARTTNRKKKTRP